jgi:predicted permease
MDLIDIVLPVFLVIGLGYVLRLRGFIPEEANAWLSRFVFYVAAPVLLLRSTSRESFSWGENLRTLLAVGGITILVAAAVYLAGRRMAAARRGVLAQASFRSNTVFFGLPVVVSAFGERVLGPLSLLIAFMVVVENLLSVLVLTLPHQRLSARDPALWSRTAARIATNPLILGCAAGVLLSTIRLHLPAGIDRAFGLVGATASPLGLLCVGAGLDFGKLRAETGATTVAAVVRLVIHPALVLLTLRALGLAGLELGMAVLLMACPTAVVTYIMARELEGDAHLAGAIVIGTTVASLATLLGWLALLRHLV